MDHQHLLRNTGRLIVTLRSNCLMQVEFFGSHRNMTVSAALLGITITHRFTGHVNLTGNMMGLDTFFHRDFQHEFGCLTDPQPGQGCQKRRPDFLVVNSGAQRCRRPIPASSPLIWCLLKSYPPMRNCSSLRKAYLHG